MPLTAKAHQGHFASCAVYAGIADLALPSGQVSFQLLPARKCAIRDGILLSHRRCRFPPCPWYEHDCERRHVPGSPNVGRRREASHEHNGSVFAHPCSITSTEALSNSTSSSTSSNVRNVRQCSGHAADCLRVSPDVRVRKASIGWLQLRSRRISERANKSPSVETGTSPCLHPKSRCWPSRLRRSALP